MKTLHGVDIDARGGCDDDDNVSLVDILMMNDNSHVCVCTKL